MSQTKIVERFGYIYILITKANTFAAHFFSALIISEVLPDPFWEALTCKGDPRSF